MIFNLIRVEPSPLATVLNHVFLTLFSVAFSMRSDTIGNLLSLDDVGFFYCHSLCWFHLAKFFSLVFW
ncbi:hypothetical protein BRY73_08520 [Ochrobactrum sp. P6BS-III]|nr:hypothetical protein BRY73_08520 [Ochrobactrum sp. P6BS-III]